MITMNTRWEPKKTQRNSKHNEKKIERQDKTMVTVNVHHGPCQTSIHTIISTTYYHHDNDNS